MQNSEYVAKMLKYMTSEAASDEQINEAMADIEAKLKAKGITVEAMAVEEATWPPLLASAKSNSRSHSE